MKKCKTFALLLSLAILINVKAQTNALHFDGNDNVKLAYNASMDYSTGNPFTIELWFRTSTGSSCEFLSNIINDIPAKGIVIGMIAGKPYFYTGNSSGVNSVYMTCNNTFNDGNWHHLACVSSGNSNASGMFIYVDGNVQTVVIGANNLTGPFNSGASYNLGSRNNGSYFYTGSFDELRFWSKALCPAEIIGRKNCHLVGNESQLLAYYNFNQGVASSNNTGINTLIDSSPAAVTGSLTGFILNGATSNWIASTTSISGTCGNFNLISVSGPTNICSGASVTLTASGSSQYTWSTGSNASSIIVVPSTNTVYSVNGGTATANCSGSNSVNISVMPSPTMNLVSSQSSLCSGSTISLSISGANSYTWNTGSNSASIIVAPTSNTVYSVVGSTSLTCLGNNSISISVSPSPTVIISASQLTVCAGSAVALSGSGADTYSFSNGATTNPIVVSPLINTFYTVLGTNTLSGCTATSGVLISAIICNGLQNNSALFSDLIISPNPFTQQLTIKNLQGENSIVLYNAIGQAILETKVNDKEYVLSLEYLEQGVYFLKVFMNGKEDQAVTKKIIKQ
ncbi:MAG: T9SS type A sorting domain-containing protein [Sphingobacteriaceae bacterium]|nr:T9SS type A sorting domain-containing protein [Sphingobacteriaceae bacterium]